MNEKNPAPVKPQQQPFAPQSTATLRAGAPSPSAKPPEIGKLVQPVKPEEKPFAPLPTAPPLVAASSPSSPPSESAKLAQPVKPEEKPFAPLPTAPPLVAASSPSSAPSELGKLAPPVKPEEKPFAPLPKSAPMVSINLASKLPAKDKLPVKPEEKPSVAVSAVSLPVMTKGPAQQPEGGLQKTPKDALKKKPSLVDSIKPVLFKFVAKLAAKLLIVPGLGAVIWQKARIKLSGTGSPAAPPVSLPGNRKTSLAALATPAPGAPPSVPLTRAARARKKQTMEMGAFYLVFILTLFALYAGGIYFSRETRVEGQVIPPPGMLLGKEALIVGDFRDLAAGIADDLAAERTPKMQEIQERQDHVLRAQADVASREERIRLLQDQIQSAKDDITSTIKQAREAAQQVWDGPGAKLEDEYNSRLKQLQNEIADRARSIKIKYQPDDSYNSPEVWANAFRLALYDVPAGVDSGKEHQWLEDEMKQWRDFTKGLDDRQKELREQAAQIQLSPTPKVTDLNAKIAEFQNRVSGAQSEEAPIKAELQQAQADLAQAQAVEAGLDDKYYKQLYSLPEGSLTKRLPMSPNGRFTWDSVEKDNAFTDGEKIHHYWVFARAIRPDGRQYWALHRFAIGKDQTLELSIEPGGFLSTKTILRPNLSPEEQQQ